LLPSRLIANFKVSFDAFKAGFAAFKDGFASFEDPKSRTEEEIVISIHSISGMLNRAGVGRREISRIKFGRFVDNDYPGELAIPVLVSFISAIHSSMPSTHDIFCSVDFFKNKNNF
jgi:hypothetical protein